MSCALYVLHCVTDTVVKWGTSLWNVLIDKELLLDLCASLGSWQFFLDTGQGWMVHCILSWGFGRYLSHFVGQTRAQAGSHAAVLATVSKEAQNPEGSIRQFGEKTQIGMSFGTVKYCERIGLARRAGASFSSHPSTNLWPEHTWTVGNHSSDLWKGDEVACKMCLLRHTEPLVANTFIDKNCEAVLNCSEGAQEL